MLKVLTNGLEELLFREGLHTSVSLAPFVVVLLTSPGLFVGGNRCFALYELVVNKRPQGLLSVYVNLRIGGSSFVSDILDNNLLKAGITL